MNELPEVMVQKAAEALSVWLAEWPEDSAKEYARACAREVLTAALLDVCKVVEEPLLRGQWSDGETWTMFPQSMATGHRWRREATRNDPTARLLRRLVLTTPAEEVSCPQCHGTRTTINDPWCEACQSARRVADHDTS